jgi:hypothetical protein
LSEICNVTTVLRWMDAEYANGQGISDGGGEVNNAKNNVQWL